MTPSYYAAITYPTQWVGGRGNVLKPSWGFWRLLLIDWCTASNRSLPRCVLTWIISHGEKKWTCHASLSTEPEHVEGNVHLLESVNEYTNVRILSSSLCACVRGILFTQVRLCEYAGPLCIISTEVPVRTFCVFARLHTLTILWNPAI